MIEIAAERRTVLKGAAAAGLVVGATALAGSAIAATPPTRASFAALIGRTFVATHASGITSSWRLDGIRDSPHRPRGLSAARLASWRQADFMLVWSTPAQAAQATYTLNNAATGAFRIFVVPGRRTTSRTTLTAIFNRWRG